MYKCIEAEPISLINSENQNSFSASVNKKLHGMLSIESLIN